MAKRVLELSSPTGKSPGSKTILLMTLEEILQRNFERSDGDVLHRDEVITVIEDEGFEFKRLEGYNAVSRAIQKAFGPHVRKYGKNHDRWMNLRRRDLTQVSAQPQPTPVAIHAPKRSVKMDLTPDEVMTIVHLRDGRTFDALCTFMGRGDTDRFIATQAASIVSKEVGAHTLNQGSSLRKTKTKDLCEFSLSNLSKELRTCLPTLTRIVQAASDNKQDHTRKTLESIAPAQTSVIAKLLAIYSERNSAYRHIISSLMLSGGATHNSMDQFAKIYDCMSKSARERKQNEFVELYDKNLVKWRAESQTLFLTFDNVDKYTRRRHYSLKTDNAMQHMVQAMAHRERVSVPSSLSSIPADKITADVLLPSLDDKLNLEHQFALVVRELWSQSIPALSWMRPSEHRHMFTPEMTTKSESVNIGVQKRNENDSSDMRELTTEFQKYCRKDDRGNLETLILTGDWLSVNRTHRVQAMQADGKTAEDRFDGLLATMADFHVQMEVLSLLYKLAYHEGSSRDIGSLYSCRNFINAKTTKKASKDYFNNGEFADKVTTAYVNLGAFQIFDIDDTSGSSTKTVKPRDSDKEAQTIALQFVRRYCDLSATTDLSPYRCPHCSQVMATLTTYAEHMRKHSSSVSGLECSDIDLVLTHTKVLLTIGLYRLFHNKMIRYGDGGQVVRSYKHLMVWCKLAGLNNYSTGLLDLQYQVHALPTHLRSSVIWNRYVNHRGKPDTNLPVDLDLEHENKYLKQGLKAYRGEYTQKALDRLTKAGNVRKEISDKFAKDTGHFKSVTKRVKLDQADIAILTTKLQPRGLLSNHSGRHFKVVHMPVNGLQVNKAELTRWTECHIRVFDTKHYYRHARGLMP